MSCQQGDRPSQLAAGKGDRLACGGGPFQYGGLRGAISRDFRGLRAQRMTVRYIRFA